MSQAKTSVPLKVANLTKNYFLSSFRNQGWEGSKWDEVNRRIKDTKEYKYPTKPKASSRTSPINIRTGKMRRQVSASLKEVTYQRIRFVVDMRSVGFKDNYAEYANESRKFMGQSARLKALQKKKITNEFRKIWNT